MPNVTPTPRTWTLRFKHNKTTLLLEVDPIRRLSEVRAELLHALQETNPSGKLNGLDIPKNADDIMLGRPVDRNNLSLGYTSLDKDSDDEQPTANGKGKGKAGSGTTAKSAASQLKDCPQGAGIKNNDMVAFKFAGESSQEDDFEVVEKWDVVVPTMEETYGEEALQDEGIGLDAD